MHNKSTKHRMFECVEDDYDGKLLLRAVFQKMSKNSLCFSYPDDYYLLKLYVNNKLELKFHLSS